MFLSRKLSNVSTKIEALHYLQTIRNYISSISETTDVDYNSMYNIEKRIVVTTFRDEQILVHQYFMSQ